MATPSRPAITAPHSPAGRSSAARRSLGELLRERAATLPHVVAIRGRGLMVACDLDIDAPEVVRRALLQQRLVVNATGPVTMRMLPPLVIGEDEIEDCVERLRTVLT